ncbi:uncharacterized protein LOC132746737 [Ruditapes philippinarum]|uniref:uncharacterized protein LOC132746737 n=1 Tax=Ruditapes philippinarum TaxID=129788 RepID=UPI00295BB54D|nr:uncharacterized protein LOC132746737 [Ruditapes philippinarum]
MTCPKGKVQCPDSYCIPLMFLCDGTAHCPNAEDEIDCGCDDSEREVLIVFEKGDVRGPDLEMLVKQLHSPKSIIRSIKYSSYVLSEGIAFTHRMLNILDKELKPFEFIDRNYECEYKILANDFLASIPFTQNFERTILYIQSSPMSEKIGELMFGNITENPNITIYRIMELSDVIEKNEFNFVIDVRVSHWKIFSSLASRYLPGLCKEKFSTACEGYYKCSSSKMCLNLDQVCDGVRDCIYGDDEFLCDFICPKQCTCEGFAARCTTFNDTEITSYPKQLRSLALQENRETKNILSKDILHFQFLYILNVSNCKIAQIQPNAFSKLINLRVLDLSNNLITTLFPSVFSGLQRLTMLKLDGNSHLSALESYTFQFLKSVRHLRISSTKIKTIASNTFAGLNLDLLEIHWQLF